MTKEKPLKLFNGRAYFCRNPDDPRWQNIASNADVHGYVAAYSRADACRVISEYTGRPVPDNELKTYWSKNCWGVSMDGIAPERGLWLKFNRSDKPIRVTK